MIEKILNETTSFCETCSSRECCCEEDCVLYRIEQIVLNKDSEETKNEQDKTVVNDKV